MLLLVLVHVHCDMPAVSIIMINFYVVDVVFHERGLSFSAVELIEYFSGGFGRQHDFLR